MASLGPQFSEKSLWKKIENQGFRFYCVGCNRERRLAPPAKVGSPQFFGHVLIATSFLTVLAYPWFHWRGLFAFVIPVGLVFELVYRMKMRGSLVCPDCQFDPILYMVDQKKAVQQVSDTWKKKFEKSGIPYPERKKAAPKREETLT